MGSGVYTGQPGVPPRVPAQALVTAFQAGRYPFWFPQGGMELALDYFAYGVNFLPLNAGATVTLPIAINSDSAFMVMSATLVECDITNLVFLGNRPLLAQIAEAGGARQLSNIQMHVDNWFGTAQNPKYWDVPKILLPNSTLNVTLQNLDGVNNRNIFVAFHGFKLFQFQG